MALTAHQLAAGSGCAPHYFRARRSGLAESAPAHAGLEVPDSTDRYHQSRSPRHAVEIRLRTLAVRMGVVPEEPRGRVAGDFNAVIQALSRSRHHRQHIVLGTVGRNMQPVEVEVAVV